MRRISPSTLRQRRLPPAARSVLSLPARSIHTTGAVALPRSTLSRRTFIASSTNAAQEESYTFPPPSSGSYPEEPEPPTGGPSASSDAADLYDYTTSIIEPSSSSSSVPADLVPALTQLYTSFLPGNQHLAQDLRPSSPFSHVITFPDDSGRPRTETPARNEMESSTAPEAVIALASPFEGGEVYVQDAVKKLANEIEADVVRLDLLTGVGLDGASSPLGSRSMSAPALPPSINPLYMAAPRPMPGIQKEISDADGGEDGHGMGGIGFSSVPIAVLGGGGMMPPGLPGLPGMGGSEEDLSPGQINLEWVTFFSNVINAGSNEPGKKRVVVLESAIAMSKSFPLWWPSFVEAVQRRRKGIVGPTPASRGGRTGKGSNSTAAPPELVYPTSIVLQCTPSVALPHTAPAYSSAGRDEDGSLREEEEHEDDSHDHADPARAALAALEEKFKSMGIHVQSHVEVVKPRNDAKLWWGSEESDMVGRREGDTERLNEMSTKSVHAVLPTFGAKSTDNEPPRARGFIQRMLMNRFGGGSQRAEEGSEVSSSLVWRAYAVIPQHRNVGAEEESRIQQRRIWSASLLQRAVHQLGGKLIDPLEVLRVSEATGKAQTRKTKLSGAGRGWGNSMVSWPEALHISSIALGSAARAGHLENGLVSVKWQDIIRAKKAFSEEKQLAAEQIKRYLPVPPSKLDSKAKAEIESAPQQVLDPVVEQIKKSKNLSQHEKRLLPCIVDTTKLASTTFKDVHLPEATVDGIRSMVSLPLLFPEAFQGGVLKDHATSGALLFGPPGTGKTLLARAVAAESGARMLAIQPSDVNDMYVGEGEKLVKAAFNLARKLSPCVVFLDEVDALFGARISRGSAGSMSHNLLLTEFMQEMDGLSSAIANKDKRVVVIGATNRPFDLDDAVLRRLPRRLLVDLPSVEGRQAILDILLRGETLAEDVDLNKLAKETDGFSGSDLKHLCVSAALSAVKDIVQVPWAKSKAAGGVGLDTGKTLPTGTRPSPGSGGGLANDVLVMAPAEGGGGGRKKAKIMRQRSTHSIIASRGESSRAMEEHGKAALPNEGDVTTSPAEQRAAAGEDGQLLMANRAGREPTADQGAEDEVIPVTSNTDKSIVKPKPRVLAWKHFKVALSEIRPSASEEGSLPELRKWSEQFGEGGSRKGKKSGFGKGFGFSDEKPKDRDSGYGRVKQEEDD
ncbi:hypothetical protein IAU60_001094 [Kwoniella sp. DSM 27419]